MTYEEKKKGILWLATVCIFGHLLVIRFAVQDEKGEKAKQTAAEVTANKRRIKQKRKKSMAMPLPPSS